MQSEWAGLFDPPIHLFPLNSRLFDKFLKSFYKLWVKLITGRFS